MNKFLVTIEFRYVGNSSIRHWIKDSHISDKYTIGVYETFEEACTNGNKALESLESKFKLCHKNSHNERFSKYGGAFNRPNTLVTNSGYLKTPFEFYAKIETLHEFEFENTIEKVLNSMNKK